MIEIPPLTHDPVALRMTYGSFPSGVIAVCALIDGEPVGMVASSFTSVSLAPPLVSVCIQDTSETWPRLRPRKRLGVSVLAEAQNAACRTLALKAGDRFEGVGWEPAANGAVFVSGATSWLECTADRGARR